MGGFLFISFFVVILLPLTIILAIIWFTSKKTIYGKAIGIVWLVVIGFVFLLNIISIARGKKELHKKDIYGEYIIDRTKFNGRQADWQYNHFRFEITQQNEFLFHETCNEKITKTYKGKIGFLEAYRIPRITISMDSTTHHIIEERPALYRDTWTFYYVFKSPRYGNVFFTKGHWKEISKH